MFITIKRSPGLMHSKVIDLTVGREKYRFCFNLYGRGGCYDPNITASRTGPNGSIAGVGPKGWPKPLGWAFGSDRHHNASHGGGKFGGRVGGHRGYRGTLLFGLPHLPFRHAYKLKRFGGLRVARIIDSVYRSLLAD